MAQPGGRAISGLGDDAGVGSDVLTRTGVVSRDSGRLMYAVDDVPV